MFRSNRLLLAVCAVVYCAAAGVSCASAGVPPAACDGYAIVPWDDASPGDVRWADYLRSHLRSRAEGGAETVPGGGRQTDGMFGVTVRIDSLLTSDFKVERLRRGVRLTARDGGTMLWLQYQLMKSLGGEDARIETSDLPPATVALRDTSGRFALGYRSLYTPASLDTDLAGILAVDNVETEWGLWGHQTDRVLGADAPQSVYATVDGKPYEGQFCYSAAETYRRIEEYVSDMFGEGDLAPMRFVVAPADDEAVCTCASCSAAGNSVRSATPAVVKLLGRLAARFPRHRFFTLGYLSTREAPAVQMPANTGVIVSAMDLPVVSGVVRSGAGRKFTDRLNEWRSAAPTVYVWDYIQNFDDYLTPFPVLGIMRERLQFYRDRGVDGVFLNGSGYDWTPFDDMRTYVLSSLMADPGQSAEALMRRFFADNYPVTGALMADYYAGLEGRAAASKQPLNLYGGIRDAESSWLDAEAFAAFYDTLGQLLPTTQGIERRRLHELLTALSYTRLEIARHHASDTLGFAVRDGDRLRVKPAAEQWLAALGEYTSFPAMRHISESGLEIGDYIAAWRSRLTGLEMPRDLLLGVALRPVSKTDEQYGDLSVLTDGVRGLAAGYHYGWHISTDDMEVEIPVEAARGARRFEMSFLDMPRHRLRAPRSVEIYKDGVLYKRLTPSYDGPIATVSAPVDLSGAAQITVKALRSGDEGAKLAADEIFLIP